MTTFATSELGKHPCKEESNEGKQYLERARLQEMLEWSCWKTNNKRNKLIVGLWKHLNT